MFAPLYLLNIGGKTLFENTLPGFKALFQGLVDKLNDYDPITNTYKKTLAEQINQENQSDITTGSLIDILFNKLGIDLNVDQLVQQRYGNTNELQINIIIFVNCKISLIYLIFQYPMVYQNLFLKC